MGWILFCWSQHFEQPGFHPPYIPVIQLIPQRYGYKKTVGDNAKGLAKFKTCNIQFPNHRLWKSNTWKEHLSLVPCWYSHTASSLALVWLVFLAGTELGESTGLCFSAQLFMQISSFQCQSKQPIHKQSRPDRQYAAQHWQDAKLWTGLRERAESCSSTEFKQE